MSGLDNPAELILKQDLVDILNAYDEARLPSSGYFRLRRAVEEIEGYRKDYAQHAIRLNEESIEHRKRLGEEAAEHAARLKKDYSEQRRLYDLEYAEQKRRLESDESQHRKRLQSEEVKHKERLQAAATELAERIAPTAAKYNGLMAKHKDLQARMEAEYTNHQKRIKGDERKIKLYPYILATLSISVCAATVLGIFLMII